MESISIKLKNCYGIQELDECLSFEEANTNLIYAPNGVMKTSLAKTFLRISNKLEPEEKLYGLKPEFEIKIDGNDIKPEQILVVRPFDPEYEAKNISTLLVNSEKKAKYESAYKEIFDTKKKAISKLNKLSKKKAEDIESQMSQDLGVDNIFEAIKLLQGMVHDSLALSDVKYAEIFDEKVLALLDNNDVKSGIAEYTTRYNELIEKSPIYSKGKFNPANAETVSKTLKKERFFEANHKIVLNGSDEPMCQPEELERTLELAHSEVLSDERLKAIHSKILSGVAAVKTFQSALEKTPAISAMLANLNDLKINIWASYYAASKADLDALFELYESKKQELISIEMDAQLEETLWHKAKETFLARFHVPFDIDIENHTNAILGTTAPNIVFKFPIKDGNPLKFDRGQLNSMDILSVGERRAMYLLYVIFEFVARINSDLKTLIIVDDIADSFDYKNKFAIIEYLRELSQESQLRFIVLTHNFDFYRTVQSRVLAGGAKWKNSHIAQKNGTQILLLNGGNKDTLNPFELWKNRYQKNAAMLVSMIPFIRNLIEYKDGTKSADYLTLTSMLHIKDDTKNLKIENLISVMSEVIKVAPIENQQNGEKLIVDFIYETADDLCLNSKADEISLENKITLSIASRLKAEEFMLGRVIDKSKISGNQTAVLFDRLSKEDTKNELSTQMKLLAQVILMTPENIHLNSFMYEPLMDMSVLHLVDLYSNLKNLV